MIYDSKILIIFEVALNNMGELQIQGIETNYIYLILKIIIIVVFVAALNNNKQLGSYLGNIKLK